MGNKEKTNNTHEVIKNNIFDLMNWPENLSVLDLKNKEITQFEDNVTLPPNLVDLNLSNNKLKVIPTIVLKLEYLKVLDLSNNQIELFDETPNFCHTIKTLDLSNNKLEGPPYWIWIENPKNLVQLNLSNNKNICQSFVDNYFEELLQYTTLVKKIDLCNCNISKHLKLMTTFRNAKVVKLGHKDYNYLSMNHLETVPCVGLESCQDIEVLHLCNTHIYSVQSNIEKFKSLIEIDLSQNNINSLPNEFCTLKNLEICILSCNRILYLPDDFHMLDRLKKLYLDNNELCMIPESIQSLDSLKILDLYNNHLYEGISDIKFLEQYDFAQNYNDEPISDEYLSKKRKLRELCHSNRLDGRAPEVVHEESEHNDDFEDADYYDEENNTQQEPENTANIQTTRSSSPEDWDSDDHWIPSHIDYSNTTAPRDRYTNGTSQTTMQWLEFVKKKMDEGNFCPMDMHLSISITEKVKYENMYNPKPEYESDGQFDDFSDDDT